MGARRRELNQDLEGEGVGSGERRKGELWNEKKLRQSSFLRVDKLAISATYKHLIFSYFFLFLFYFGSCGRLSWLNCQLSSAR